MLCFWRHSARTAVRKVCITHTTCLVPLATPCVCVLAGAPGDAGVCASPPLLRALSIGGVASILLRAAGTDGRRAVYQTCRDARDSVLRAAAAAKLYFDLTKEGPCTTLFQQLSAARQRLATRGKTPTTLSVLCGSSTKDSDTIPTYLLALVPAQLHTAGAGIRELIIRVARWSTCPTQAALEFALQGAGQAFPHLRSLWFIEMPCSLPPPHFLPQLTEIKTTVQNDSVWSRSERDVCTKVAPYMSQLQRLQLSRSGRTLDLPWPILFSQTTTTTPLQCLSVQADLNDELIGRCATVHT